MMSVSRAKLRNREVTMTEDHKLKKEETKNISSAQEEKYKKLKKSELLKEMILKENELEKKSNQIKELHEKITKLESKNKNMKEQLIRMQADFENYQKREQKKKQEFMEFAKKDLIYHLLPVIDNLERAAIYTEDKNSDVHSVKEGIKGTLQDLLKLLEKEGLKPIESVGKKFDPYCHEAIMQVESEKFPEDTVAEEFSKGYFLKSKVLRPSVVKVSKGPGEKEKSTKNK